MTSANISKEMSFTNTGRTVRPGKCRRIRTRLHQPPDQGRGLISPATRGRGLDAGWVQKHIASCPRCQQRLAAIGKVELAMSLVKSQRHGLDLLMRANVQAIGVLKRSLRQAPKAEKLKNALPERNLLERLSKYAHSAVNVAACFAILILMRIGIFSSMGSFESRSRGLFKQYYAAQAGKDLAEELFPA